MPRVVYLARGKLHVRDERSPPRVIESRFGEALVDRAARLEQRHAWKAQGRGAQFMSGGLLWGMQQAQARGVRYAITSLCRGRSDGELLYALDSNDIGGVFAVDAEGAEDRLFHSAEHRVQHLDASGGEDHIACSVGHESGAASLAVMKADGSTLVEVTEGDSVDLAPRWAGPGQLVYQSAGIGRDRSGVQVGLGPFAVHRLDLGRGEITALAESPAHDLLGPQVAADGALYYIKRPWRAPGGASPLRAVLDFVLFPVRLVFAVFSWLNFFTARYTGKPLTTAGGPRKEGADLRQMMVWGNLIDAERAAAGAARRGEEAPALVPASWQLCRRRGAGEEVLARAVLAFDLCADGSVVYSNGSAVFHLADGRATELFRDDRIEQVVALG